MFLAYIFSIPAFARKYDMSCNVCHSPFSKLKPYGEKFAANGFKLKDKEAVRYTRVTGDDNLILFREPTLLFFFDGRGEVRRVENAYIYKQDFKERI